MSSAAAGWKVAAVPCVAESWLLRQSGRKVDKRVRQEGDQLQHKLEDLVAQRQAELQETVAFLNLHLSSCQDMVQALQRFTELAYATVEIWLQEQVQL